MSRLLTSLLSLSLFAFCVALVFLTAGCESSGMVKSRGFAGDATADTAFVSPAAPPMAVEHAAGAGAEKDPPAEEEGSFREDLRSGVLTAASIDDLADFSFINKALGDTADRQSDDPFTAFARALRQPKFVVRVTDPAGKPVHDAAITVTAGDRDPLRLRSGTDGHVVFAFSHDRIPADAEVAVTATAGAATERVAAPLDGPRVIDITLDGQGLHTAPAQRLDLVLVVDCTGSMGDELEYLKVELRDVVNRVEDLHPGVEQRWALVVYRDDGDKYVSRSYDFTGSLDKLISRLGKQSSSGGGDEPEAVHAALADAVDLDWTAAPAARVAFWIADAPPHAGKLDATLRAVDRLRERGVRVYPVAASSASLYCELTMRGVALLTGARYQFITDHSGIGNPHREPEHAQPYVVESLRGLMVNLLDAELAGIRLQAPAVPADGQADPMALHTGPPSVGRG